MVVYVFISNHAQSVIAEEELLQLRFTLGSDRLILASQVTSLPNFIGVIAFGIVLMYCDSRFCVVAMGSR